MSTLRIGVDEKYLITVSHGVKEKAAEVIEQFKGILNRPYLNVHYRLHDNPGSRLYSNTDYYDVIC